MIINGKEMNFAEGISIKDLIEKLNLNPNTIVVELNLEIISKDEYVSRKLSKKDKIEIISFVGGG